MRLDALKRQASKLEKIVDPTTQTLVEVAKYPNARARLYTLEIQPPCVRILNTDPASCEFVGQPTRNDPVFCAIREGIRQLSVDDTQFANAHITVMPTTPQEPPIWPPRPKRPRRGKKMYTFMDPQRIPLTVHIKVGHPSNPLRGDSLCVRTTRKALWQPLMPWLLTIPVIPVFRFIDLPIELQIKIVSIHIGDLVWPRSSIPSLCEIGTQMEHVWADTYKLFNCNKNCLLRVSPHLARVTLKAAMTCKWKGFTSVSALKMTIQAPPSWAKQHGWLKRVELYLTDTQYFTFFGVLVEKTSGALTRYAIYTSNGSLLRGLTQLQELCLSFRCRKGSRRRRVSPWVGTVGGRRIPCQTTVVDWIATFAYEEIRQIPAVWFRSRKGIVTKFTTVPITEGKYISRLKESHSYDSASQVAAILALPQTAL